MERRTFLGWVLSAVGGFLAARAAVAAPKNEARRGYGPCKHRSCDCNKFLGSGNTCKCGHSFYDHR